MIAAGIFIALWSSADDRIGHLPVFLSALIAMFITFGAGIGGGATHGTLQLDETKHFQLMGTTGTGKRTAIRQPLKEHWHGAIQP